MLADSLSPCRLSDVILFALSIGIPRRFKTPIYLKKYFGGSLKHRKILTDP